MENIKVLGGIKFLLDQFLYQTTYLHDFVTAVTFGTKTFAKANDPQHYIARSKNVVEFHQKVDKKYLELCKAIEMSASTFTSKGKYLFYLKDILRLIEGSIDIWFDKRDDGFFLIEERIDLKNNKESYNLPEIFNIQYTYLEKFKIQIEDLIKIVIALPSENIGINFKNICDGIEITSDNPFIWFERFLYNNLLEVFKEEFYSAYQPYFDYDLENEKFSGCLGDDKESERFVEVYFKDYLESKIKIAGGESINSILQKISEIITDKESVSNYFSLHINNVVNVFDKIKNHDEFSKYDTVAGALVNLLHEIYIRFTPFIGKDTLQYLEKHISIEKVISSELQWIGGKDDFVNTFVELFKTDKLKAINSDSNAAYYKTINDIVSVVQDKKTKKNYSKTTLETSFKTAFSEYQSKKQVT